MAEDFRRTAEAAGCVLSDKSELLTSDKALQADIGHKLRARGLKVRAVRQARDLGLPTAAGRERPTAVTVRRLAKVRSRVLRIGKFAKTTRQAAKLFTTGAWPAQDGHESAPRHQKSMRKLAELEQWSTVVQPWTTGVQADCQGAPCTDAAQQFAWPAFRAPFLFRL